MYLLLIMYHISREIQQRTKRIKQQCHITTSPLPFTETSRDVGEGVSWQSTQICSQEKNKSFHHKIGVVYLLEKKKHIKLTYPGQSHVGTQLLSQHIPFPFKNGSHTSCNKSFFLQYRGLNNEKTQNMQILIIVSHFMNIFHYLPIHSFKHFIELIVKSKMKYQKYLRIVAISMIAQKSAMMFKVNYLCFSWYFVF